MSRATHSAPGRTALRWFKSSYSNGNGGTFVRSRREGGTSSPKDEGAPSDQAAQPCEKH